MFYCEMSLTEGKISFLCSLVTSSLLFYTNNMAGAVMAVMVW
jgi:hypothetical protein